MRCGKKSMVCLLIGIIILFGFSNFAYASNVSGTVHNLSTSGPGDIKSGTEDRVCIFCHTPHNSNPQKPIWSHKLSGTSYTEYSSSTLDTTSDSMTGMSGSPTELCLSCHDGTIAMGNLVNMADVSVGDSSTGKLAADESFASGANANLGTDLSDDHPVLFKPDGSDSEINTSSDGVTLYDSDGYVQCTSCHDPHNNEYGNFLVNQYKINLCETCHTKTGWSNSGHLNSGMVSCANCHTTHNASVPTLLKPASEEQVCLMCHTSINDTLNNASSVHPVKTISGNHDATENNTDGKVSSGNKHSECSDCHDPHQVTSSNPLKGVPGFDLAGNAISSVTNSYELCYKCHQNSGTSGSGLQESADTVKYTFDNRTSTHGNGTNVERCNKCHGNNTAEPNGAGIHGSNEPGLLTMAQYSNGDDATKTDYTCVRCHDDTNGKEMPPKIHFTAATGSKHNTKCTACHGDSVNYNSGTNVGSKTGVPHGSNVSPLLKNPQPAVCLDSGCHSSTDQSNSETTRYPNGYDIPNSGHPYNITNDGSNNPQDGSGWSSSRPVTNTSGCQSCHTEPSVSSNAPHATDSSSLLLMDISSQGICVECHDTPSDNLHSEHAHESSGDCYYCHIRSPHDSSGEGDPYGLIAVSGNDYLSSFQDATSGSTDPGYSYDANDCDSSWSGSGDCGGEH